jgi:hypothetical protein
MAVDRPYSQQHKDRHLVDYLRYTTVYLVITRLFALLQRGWRAFIGRAAT